MRLLPIHLEKVGRQWCIVIRLGPNKNDALKKARRLGRKLAPAELMPRALDGTLDVKGRETYTRKDDPKGSKG